jgi:hypothetical protein
MGREKEEIATGPMEMKRWGSKKPAAKPEVDWYDS